MTREQAIRRVRFAASAICLLFCAAFVALWVRSYSHLDEWGQMLTDNRSVRVDSVDGLVNFNTFYLPGSQFDESVFVTYLTPAIPEVERIWADPPNLPLGFAVSGSAIGQQVTVPHWFPALVFGALAAAFGIRAPYRFSMRTLLIACTVVAVVLGAVVIAAR
jgi:hypothetical protein